MSFMVYFSHREIESCHRQSAILHLYQVPGQLGQQECSSKGLPDADPIQVAVGRQLAQEKGMRLVYIELILIQFRK